MASVDDRIVSMQFENKAFQEKVASTIASMDKLKTSLDFTNANKGMGDLTKAAHNFNLQGIASAVDGIAGKFTAMGAVAFSIIDNVVTKVMHAGISIAKSLSLDQIISGFREYETNMNSIQTILANTRSDATTLDQVNSALNQLNEYSDKTIYNFSQMAKNIGTFTAAGVDLDTSVAAIKGIANLAAVSGSNAEQASSAMYQLSQAIATGTLRVIDWNSVNTAGMGGEVFQKALFETGKALKTLKGVNMGTTFEEWTSGGNSFRGSLEAGWLTSEVLTTTLQGFTGDLTEAQILAMGYTKAQVAEILEMGRVAQAAATEVKTLTQLIGTVKESIGSGWSASFRIIIGDFEQAKELFTGINDAIGGYVKSQADARNALLQGWSDLGGRTKLIEGLKDVFEAIGQVLKPIKEAFKSIFPPMTAEKLFELTKSFREFAYFLRISGDTADTIRTIFAGLFGALEIGWTIVKETAKLIGELFSSFASENGEGILGFFTDVATKIAYFNGLLVAGGGIEAFFDKLSEAIQNPGLYIDILKTKFEDLKTKIQEVYDHVSAIIKNADFGTFGGISTFFDKMTGFLANLDFDGLSKVSNFFRDIFDNFDPELTNSMEGGFSRLGDRLQLLGDIFGKVWGVIKGFWKGMMSFGGFVKDTIGSAVDTISNFGPKLIEAVSNVDFDKVLEVIQTGIAAVFAGSFSKIAKDGLKIDLTGGALTGLGDFFKGLKDIGPGISKALGEVTGTLEAMQMKLKAEALQKIAIAMGILAVSMILLSTVEPEALGKALGAMAVGFAQLATTMAILDKAVNGPMAAAKLGILATGLVILAGAMVLLATAAKIFATMNMEELGKGLGAITVLLGALIITAKLLQGNTAGLITAGIGIMFIAVALNILAGAVKLFSMMSWEELGKGFAAVGVGLGLIAGAMHLMPKDLLVRGAGLVLIATALNILALAVKSFAEMSWSDMAKGFSAVAVGLGMIAGAMHLMPPGPTMVLSGIGLVAIGVALNLMAAALKIMATMSWKEIAKGLTAMAGALLIIVVAARLMEGAIVGAIAIGLMSIALSLLVKVLKEFAKMKWSEMLKGLAGLAAVMLVLGAAAYILSPVVVSMLALGAAMLLLGAGFALFGLGAQAVAVAFGLIAAAGRQGVEVLMFALDEFLTRLPAMLEIFTDFLLFLVKKILDAAPSFVEAIGKILIAFLQVIIDAIPKAVEVIVTFIQAMLKAIRDLVPDIVATGFEILIGLLTGVRDNIGEITILVAEIITNFLDALALKVPEIIDSVYNLVRSIFVGVAEKLFGVHLFLLQKGIDFIQGILDGIVDKAKEVFTWFANLTSAIWDEIGDVASSLAQKGKDLIQGILDGLIDKFIGVITWVANIPSKIWDALIDLADILFDIGKKIMQGLWDGMKDIWHDTTDWLSGLNPANWKGPPARDAVMLVKNGMLIMGGLLSGLQEGWGSVTGWLKSVNPADFINPGIVNRSVETINSALHSMVDQLGDLKEFTPTITPVLNLSSVRNEAAKLGSILATSTEVGTTAYDQARTISFDTNNRIESEAPVDSSTKPIEVKFEQNNYSPEALSVADIYQQTRNQIELAKEELAVI